MSLQHILKNSSVSGKEPLASQLANGELSINYHADGPFLCCKDTAGNVRRVAGVWVATTAPSTPFPGELWLDTGITPSQLKVYKDSTDGWTLAGSVNSASTTSEGIVRLATNGDTQTGTNATSAVTPASLQSKISDSTTTVSSTTIASSTAVKSVGDLASAALPKSGGTITGTLEIGNTGQIRFEGSSDDAYETTLAVEDPTAPRTITLPDRSGTVITTGDTGTVTNTMLAGSIADSKLSTITTADKVSLSALNIDGATDIGGALSDADLFIVDDGANGTNRKTPATRISDYTFGKVNGAVTIANNGTSSLGTGVIVNTNVSNTAAIAVSKLANGTARQLLQTDAAGTGVEWTSNVDIPGTLDVTGATTLDSTLSVPLGSDTAPTIHFGTDTNTGIYSPGADQVAISTNGTGRLFVDANGNVGVGTSNVIGNASSVYLTVNGSTLGGIALKSADSTIGYLQGESTLIRLSSDGAKPITFDINGSERLRIDSSGRLLVGTSTGRDNFYNTTQGAALQVEGDNSSTGRISVITNFSTATSGASGQLVLGRSGSTSIGSTTIVANDNQLGIISFQGADNTNFLEAARIAAEVDNTPGANDMPGRLVFSTTADGSALPTERMRIDSSGRLLVNTSSSVQNLLQGAIQVVGTDENSYITATRYSSDAGSGPGIVLGRSKSATKGTNTIVANGDVLGAISFSGANGTSFDQAANIIAFVDGTPGANDMPGRLVFSTTADGSATPTERMRIDSSGRVGIGTSSPAYQLQLSTDSAGKPSTNTWTIVSDERIKEDVELADLDICYQTIKTIPLKRFKWKDKVYTAEQVPDRHKLGWIAQDVEPVFPKAVHIHEFKYNQVFEEIVIPAVEEELDEDGNVVTPAQPERTEKGELVSEEVIEDCRDLNVDQLYAAMYGAMQKLIQKVEILEAEVAALKGA